MALPAIGAVASALALGATAPAARADAQRPPPPSHIRVIPFDPDTLVALHGQIGFEMMVEFAPDEHIDNVAIGDGLAWQVTPNKRANLLFLKPLDPAVTTNMTVVTDLRRYAFELDAKGVATGRHRGRNPGESRGRTYVVRFVYPAVQVGLPPAPPPPIPPERRNTRYSITGDRALTPSEVFDDGHFTYFRWPDSAATPAIFAISGDSGETLVNYAVREGFLVVEQVAPRFVLRNGRQVSTVFNDTWREPDPGPDAPRARKDGRVARGGKSL